LPDGLILQGAGRDATTLRRMSSAGNTSDMFRLIGKTGNVTISDVTLDYNRAQQTGGPDLIWSTAATVTNFTLQRLRLMHAPQLSYSPSPLTIPYRHAAILQSFSE